MSDDRQRPVEDFREWVNSDLQLYPEVWPAAICQAALAEIDELRRRESQSTDISALNKLLNRIDSQAATIAAQAAEIERLTKRVALFRLLIRDTVFGMDHKRRHDPEVIRAGLKSILVQDQALAVTNSNPS